MQSRNCPPPFKPFRVELCEATAPAAASAILAPEVVHTSNSAKFMIGLLVVESRRNRTGAVSNAGARSVIEDAPWQVPTRPFQPMRRDAEPSEGTVTETDVRVRTNAPSI